MWIKEVCAMTGLTKKAVEYYIDRGLLQPQSMENGYRNFSQQDIELLKKISILRRLSVPLPQIRQYLQTPNENLLQQLAFKMELEQDRAKQRKTLLEQLGNGTPWNQIAAQLDILDQQQTILEKLQLAFPGYLGRIISLHFALFLQEPIKTQAQRKAYQTIVTFLDHLAPLTPPPELTEYLEESSRFLEPDRIRALSKQMQIIVQDVVSYMERNKETLEQYMAFKTSDVYRQSPAYQLQQWIQKFQTSSGYNNIFLPAMRALSTSYDTYCTQLETANEQMLKRYPQTKVWNDKSISLGDVPE